MEEEWRRTTFTAQQHHYREVVEQTQTPLKEASASHRPLEAVLHATPQPSPLADLVKKLDVVKMELGLR